MNIKKVSEKMGISADTIRYYEKIGLIHPIKRNENGVRVFDEEDLRWIHFARAMRTAGLSIESLTAYVRMFREGDQTIEDRKDILRDQIEDLTERINVLQAAKDRLEFKLANYDTHLKPYETSLREGEQVNMPS
ncbi:MerR family transcriptional regulator [Aerococcaceae bacterium 50-4]